MLSGVFVFQYYVYTINLNSLLVSIGLTIQLIVAAFFSILWGVIIDNKKPGKFGKRRPYLFYGLPIWVVTGILLWLPPWYGPKDNSMFWPTAIYFWVIITVKAIAGTSVIIAHASMFPEQSQTDENRKKVASVGTIWQINASILGLLLP
jgi:Na+/melibiose symporter-like transporter